MTQPPPADTTPPAPPEGPIFDTHSHLHNKEFDEDRDAVMERAAQACVEHVVLIGQDPVDTTLALSHAARDPRYLVCTGLHPHHTAQWSAQTAEAIRHAASDPSVVGIGEMGLDYHYDFAAPEAQREAFLGQMEIARDLDLPIVIHCREAYDDTLAVLREFYGAKPASHGPPRGVMHCWFGPASMAPAFLQLGFMLGIGGGVTFKKADEVHETVRRVPLETLVLETDAPYMAPAPHRGKRNEPAHLQLVAARIAELAGLSAPDVLRITNANAHRLYRMDLNAAPAIAYRIRDGLYVNLTNRCTNLCVFCDRLGSATVKGHNLRLRREPEAADVVAAVEAQGGAGTFQEIVFCGYGEPTIRLDVLLESARRLKAGGARSVRVNTNGHGDLFHGRPVAPLMAGQVDAVSISLNAADATTYNRLCRPHHPACAFDAVVEFIRSCVGVIPSVTATAVAMPGLDIAPIEALARSLGAEFRARPYGQVG